MFLLDEDLLNEFFNFSYSVDIDNLDRMKMKIEYLKDKISEDTEESFEKNRKSYLMFSKDLLVNFLRYGLLMGPYVILFSMSLTLIKIIAKKSLRSAKDEMEQSMVVDNIRIYINYLTKIKMKNKNLSKKIDNTIVFLDNSIDGILDED